MRHKIRRKEKSSVGTAANCYKKAQAGGFEFFSQIVFIGRGRKHDKAE